MRQTLVLTRLDQLRALGDPLRLRLIETLAQRDASVAELARAVRVPVTRLYHHVDLLLEAGLIEVVGRVRRRGAEQRRFRAVARSFTLDRGLLTPTGDARATGEVEALVRGVLGGALEELGGGLADGRIDPRVKGHGLVLEDHTLRLSAAGFARLAKELPAWLDGFAKRHRAAKGASFRVVLAVYPRPADGASGHPTQTSKPLERS